MTVDTRTALLDAAEYAARARGFDGFSYADLADSVGIRKASVHYHFATKADLCAAMMDRYGTDLGAACDQITARHQTGGARLLALIALYRDALQGGKTLCLCVALTGSRASLPDAAIEQIKAFRAMMLARLAAVFSAGQKDSTIKYVSDPGSEACATLALLEGAHLTARAAENVGTFDNAVRVLKSRC
jgi:TetR/AcrR family transcriptional repressor of nem operon